MYNFLASFNLLFICEALLFCFCHTASNGITRTKKKSKWYLIQLAPSHVMEMSSEERGDSALNQASTCSLWTCPDIKQSWNLTHTSYIDLHSLVIPFEGPWRPLFTQVCVKFKCEGVVLFRPNFETHVIGSVRRVTLIMYSN